jgi:glycerol-3-phosphate dehydrogenase (NAD(P)+)
MARRPEVCVLGGGLWGTVLAQQLSGRARVRLWEFFPQLADVINKTRRHPNIPGFRLDPSVKATSDLDRAVSGASLLVFVLPSSVLAKTARRLRGRTAPGCRAVVASKGVEPGSLATMGEVVEREIPALKGRTWTLTGPSFAREVARSVPTGLMLGGPLGAASRGIARLFAGDALAVTPTSDRVGAELGGSLKNVIAVGAGILDGLGTGSNTKAALLVQGLAEIGAVIRAHGGRAETVYGLAGLGDLIVTGTGGESRNRAFGEKLGQGLSPEKALKQITTVVEGIEAAGSALALCRRHRVKAPLIAAIGGACEGAPPRRVLAALGFKP